MSERKLRRSNARSFRISTTEDGKKIARTLTEQDGKHIETEVESTENNTENTINNILSTLGLEGEQKNIDLKFSKRGHGKKKKEKKKRISKKKQSKKHKCK